jgi:hypothetical protein
MKLHSKFCLCSDVWGILAAVEHLNGMNSQQTFHAMDISCNMPCILKIEKVCDAVNIRATYRTSSRRKVPWYSFFRSNGPRTEPLDIPGRSVM